MKKIIDINKVNAEISNLNIEKLDLIKQVNLNYINNHLGGTELVYNYIKQQLRA